MTTTRLLGLLLTGATLAFSAGCAASAGAGAEGSAQAGAPRVRSNLLVRGDLEAHSGQNLYEVIRRLRPQWLQVRASRGITGDTELVVFQDNTLVGGVDVLRQMQTDMVTSVEYLDASTATNTLPGLGSRHVAGAIVVRTR